MWWTRACTVANLQSLYTPVVARHVLPAGVNRDQSTIQKNFPPNLTNHHSGSVNRPQLAVILVALLLLPLFLNIFLICFVYFFFLFKICSFRALLALEDQDRRAE